nr:hypothetical protein [Sphingomonas sp.]
VASEGFRRLQENGERHEVTVKRLGCITYRPGDETAFRSHFNAGVALSDLYCDDYFRRIAVHKQKRQFGRSTTNDLGTAVSSVLGLASAGSIATGGAGVLFGLGDGVWRNYDTAFLVEPDLGKMLELVRVNQKTMRDQYGGAAKFGSYFEANSAINDYAQLCSYAGMDKLLNKALEIATDEQTIDQTVTRFQTARARAGATAAEANLELVKRKVKADEEAAKLLGQGPGQPVSQAIQGNQP